METLAPLWGQIGLALEARESPEASQGVPGPRVASPGRATYTTLGPHELLRDPCWQGLGQEGPERKSGLRPTASKITFRRISLPTYETRATVSWQTS